MSNMYGMVLARYKKFPQVKTKGLSSLPPLVVFTSADVSFISAGLGGQIIDFPNQLKRPPFKLSSIGAVSSFVQATHKPPKKNSTMMRPKGYCALPSCYCALLMALHSIAVVNATKDI